MKWLILLMLISCGKNESPNSVDLNDYDGDQNIAESGFEKYIADVGDLGTINGMITFTTNGNYALSFSNEYYNPKSMALKLLSGSMNNRESEHYFTEGTKLEIVTETKDIKVRADTVQISVNFKQLKDHSLNLIYINGKEAKDLGRIQEKMSVTFTRSELEQLLAKESHFIVKKNFKQEKFFNTVSSESIKQKTLRVFVSDNENTKIYYMSKSIPKDEMLNYLNINDPIEVTDEDLFFNSQAKSEEMWFSRKYENGTLVYVFTTLQDLKKSFFNKFSYQKLSLTRVNGTPTSSIDLKNIPKLIYLKVRPSLIVRTFQTSTRSRKFEHKGHEEYYTYRCHYNTRDVASEVTAPVQFKALSELLTSNEAIEKFNPVEQQDEKGIYWEIIITLKHDYLKLDLKPRPAQSYYMTGDYEANCEKERRAPVSTNDEAKLSFEIESFIENVDQ